MKTRINIFLTLLLAFIFVGCSPKVVSSISTPYTPLSEDQEVLVLETYDELPTEAIILGTVKIGDTGFTASSNGTYDEVLRLAKEQARKAGGNAIKINQHQTPDFYSSVHRIFADILYIEDPSSIVTTQESILSDHPDYAVLYFYRLSGMGPLINYDVSIDETKVFRAKINTKAEVKVYEEGDYEIWGRTEAKSSIPLHIVPGHDYYIRCSVTMGAFLGRPLIEQVSAAKGREQFSSIIDAE